MRPRRNELDAQLYDRWRRAYQAVPGHGHVHGASLGFSADAYLQVGGFQPLACDEDVDLVRRFKAAGLQVQALPGLEVATSARQAGRVPGGFSGYLSRLAATG